jgi:uncharacterized protein YraI
MFKPILGLLFAALLFAAFPFAQPASAQVQNIACAPALPTRLYVGGQGQVTPGAPNILRSQPYRGGDSIVLGEIPALGIFTVIGGPSCYDGMSWWQVNYNGQIGWTPEGANYGVYWTEPITSGGCMALPSRLIAGQGGRVLPGLPNLLRSQPYRGFDSQILAQMPANSTFSVIAGPNCSEGMTWWLVSYNGVNGWTPEGQAGQYWLEPYGYIPPPQSCNTFSVHMLIGYTGTVAPGIPNRLRATPSLNGQFLANMTAGTTFTVLGGPTCADGLLWWQVNYRGTAGWTVEGQNGNYWINPVACPGFQNSRLRVGGDARVTPGLPNRLRTQASTASQVVTLIPAGGVMRVLGDPVCSENAAWWRVRYGSWTGWTMEGQGGEYWLEPS